jgi:predicted Zn-dependent protease
MWKSLSRFATWTLFSLLIASVFTPSALASDQHTVDAIVAALRSPISAEAAAQAREMDDQILSGGQTEDNRVYLVSDARLAQVTSLAGTILQAGGEDPSRWVVRVLDTTPKTVNAFVFGGRYIYVYTGLLEQSPSTDELAFILSHELGHSLLKHGERKANDASTTLENLAGLAVLLSPKNKEVLSNVSAGISSAYSRLDEEEADALGVCIARRAGYDPMRGVDFFTRGIREREASEQQRDRTLAEAKAAYEEALTSCTQNKRLFNSSPDYQTQENANKVNAMCADAEQKRLHYNEVVESYNASLAEDRRDLLLSDHPQDQARIATLAALTDYLSGRRELESLSKYQQTYRVMSAVQQVRAELTKVNPAMTRAAVAPRDSVAVPSTGKTLEEELRQLKRAHDQGLITDAEYERKRQEILARY